VVVVKITRGASSCNSRDVVGAQGLRIAAGQRPGRPANQLTIYINQSAVMTKSSTNCVDGNKKYKD